MANKNRLAQLEKLSKPKPKEHTAQVVIYRVGESVKTTKTANVTVFIPDNLRDKVTA